MNTYDKQNTECLEYYDIVSHMQYTFEIFSSMWESVLSSFAQKMFIIGIFGTVTHGEMNVFSVFFEGVFVSFLVAMVLLYAVLSTLTTDGLFYSPRRMVLFRVHQFVL